MQIDMTGRTALITGGSQGLGFAAASRFAESGANVVLLARRPDVLEAAARALRGTFPKARIGAYACDVVSAKQIEDTYAAVMRDFGRIDILLNNAGKATVAPFVTVTDAMWQDDLELKLYAGVRLTRLVWPQMVERKWGRVINVLNTFAKAPIKESAPTSVTRAAQMALTKVLSLEGAPHNILVNALLIGLIVSEQVVRRHAAAKTNQSLEAYIAEQGSRVPLGRMGTAEEFGNIACFLASDASSFITGTAINVDGGSCPIV